MIERNFNLHLTAGHSTALVINVNQFDQGEKWIFTLYNENGTQYIPSTGAIVGIKSDGLGIINSGSVVDGKVVIMETEQMTAAVGKAVFELMIDSQTHGTANFIVLVEPKPGNNADLSESDLSLLQEAIDATSPLPTGGSVGQVLTKTANGSAWSDAGTPTQEQVADAVSDWADEHITVETGVVIDTSLSVAGAAADAKKTGDEITDLKSAIEENTGLSQTEKNLILQLFQNMASGSNAMLNTYNSLANLWRELGAFSVTNALTNVSNSNSATSVKENSAYTGTLSANSGYELGTVTVTMGGVDVTATAYSNGVVSIASVTGDVVITASGVSWDYSWTPASGTLDDAGFAVTANSATFTYGADGVTIKGGTTTTSSGIIDNPASTENSLVVVDYLIRFTKFAGRNNCGFGSRFTYNTNKKYTNFRVGCTNVDADGTGGFSYTTGSWTYLDTPKLLLDTDYRVRITYDALGNFVVKIDGEEIFTHSVGSGTNSGGNAFDCMGGTYILKELNVRASS